MSCHGEHCITCSDEGIEMEVVSADGHIALCRDPHGDSEEIDVALVERVVPGDLVLAHARVALAHLGRAGATA